MKFIDGFIVDIKVMPAYGAAYKLFAETREPDGGADARQWHVPFQGVLTTRMGAEAQAGDVLDTVSGVTPAGEPQFDVLAASALESDWWVPVR